MVNIGLLYKKETLPHKSGIISYWQTISPESHIIYTISEFELYAGPTYIHYKCR